MSKIYNPYDTTNGNGYQSNPLCGSTTIKPSHCDSLAHKPNIKSNPETQSLDELAREIAERGNDMQTTHSKDGLKVFEVSKKLVRVIPN